MVRFLRRARWYGYYSQKAVDKGCPVSTFQGHDGREYVVTALSSWRDGHNYWWDDKIFVGEVTGCKRISTTGYQPVI